MKVASFQLLVGHLQLPLVLIGWVQILIKANNELETFMAVVQRTGAGSKPRISRVVSKSDSDHGTATTATEPLG